MRTYLLVETEIVPGSQKGLLTTFHGLFTSMDKAQAALKTVAATLLKNPTFGEMGAHGRLADPEYDTGREVCIYIQIFGAIDKMII